MWYPLLIGSTPWSIITWLTSAISRILIWSWLATLACSSQYADITGDAFDIITDKQALTINLLYDTAKDEFYTKEYDDYLYIQESVDTGYYILEDDEYEWFEDLLVSLN